VAKVGQRPILSQTGRSYRLIDRAASRKLLFKLAAINLTDILLWRRRRFARCQGCMSSYSRPSELHVLRLPVWKGIFRNDTNQNETHAESVPVIRHSGLFSYTISKYFPDQLSHWPRRFIPVYN